jgi:hypothetical protein
MYTACHRGFTAWDYYPLPHAATFRTGTDTPGSFKIQPLPAYKQTCTLTIYRAIKAIRIRHHSLRTSIHFVYPRGVIACQ